MKLAHNVYPSHIAKVLAYEVGLLSDMQTDIMVSEKVREERDKIIMFQQLSLVASFEDALTVYFGMGLSESQIENLKIIYEVTPQLLPGTVMCQALETVARERKRTHPDMAVIASSLHTAINVVTKKQRMKQ